MDYTVSSGPPAVEIPPVKNQPAAEAQSTLEGLGLVVTVAERNHASVPAGEAVKTEPAAGEQVEVGTAVTLVVSKGPKQVTVPNIVGETEADALAALTEAQVAAGERSEAVDESVPAGSIISQDPAADSTVDKDAAVAYTVSVGPAIEPMGLGGDLDDPDVMTQMDTVGAETEAIRGIELEATSYDGVSEREQQLALQDRIGILHDLNVIDDEEKALKRLGLLDGGDDLEGLLKTLYGQALPVAYLESENRQSILNAIDKLDGAQRAEAAREFGRTMTLQDNGADAARVGDKSRGDEAMAAYALEQGDGTAVLIDWAATNGNKDKADQVIVPGDDGVLASMPLLLQREYSFPFLEGRIFVDRLRESGGWGAVDEAWGGLPESTEQILHPKLYPGERPRAVEMDDIASRLGNGWKAKWQQTMGELRIGVWLANGQPGEQSGPRAAVKLPKANAAAGWSGDTLVSLNGPDGQWAIVWQTRWDTEQDVEQFVQAADAVINDLAGSGVVLTEDVSGGASNPALVLITGSDDTLVAVSEALGVVVADPQ